MTAVNLSSWRFIFKGNNNYSRVTTTKTAAATTIFNIVTEVSQSWWIDFDSDLTLGISGIEETNCKLWLCDTLAKVFRTGCQAKA